MGVAQYGQRVEVRLPVKVVWPPQFWQTTSFSPSMRWLRRFAAPERKVAIAALRSCSTTALPAVSTMSWV